MAVLQNVSSTLATISETMVKINITNNPNATNSTADDVKPIAEMDIFYEASFFVHLLSAIYVIFKVINQKKCEGFSLKTQGLITISSLLRYMLATESTASVLYVPKVMQLFVDAGAFLAVYTFQSSKTRKLDPCRWELIFLGCFFLSQIKLDATFSEAVLTLCLMIDSVALLPQYILIDKTMYVSKGVLRYIHLYLVGQIMFTFHLYRLYCYGYGIPQYEVFCRGLLSKLCIIVMGMLVFLNYMRSVLNGYANELKARLDTVAENNGHEDDCPQKLYPVELAVPENVYLRNKQEAENEDKA